VFKSPIDDVLPPRILGAVIGFKILYVPRQAGARPATKPPVSARAPESTRPAASPSLTPALVAPDPRNAVRRPATSAAVSAHLDRW
jgi:hypothetical protein